MNYLMVDISGKVPKYDIALCEALAEQFSADDSLELLAANIDPKKIQCKSKKLLSLVPKSLQNSEHKLKRIVKALEGVFNYLYIVIRLLFGKVDVLHFQWLPFLEISSVERIFLRLVKIVSPKTKLFLTVHNIYPHNFSDVRKSSYRTRFAKVERFFDRFIVHLEVSKKEFCSEFCIAHDRVNVIHHGVFEPKGLKVMPHVRGEKLNLIMYGNQSYYKGTDILVDAIALLPKDVQEKVHTLIVGKIEPDYYAELKEKSKDLDIEWSPEFVPDDVLYSKIMESDVIVLPYREISQSGVLLLALSFERIVITSNLPSFVETLNGLSDDCFFENGNSCNLALILKKTLECPEIYAKNQKKIREMVNGYSWENAAIKLINVERV